MDIDTKKKIWHIHWRIQCIATLAMIAVVVLSRFDANSLPVGLFVGMNAWLFGELIAAATFDRLWSDK